MLKEHIDARLIIIDPARDLAVGRNTGSQKKCTA